ncbi:hypothetical protein EPH_0057800 [Eimeria praecox]|uniref:Uncharacterized protein n=1 Tax=Eimeria praecox TaxID=51316 RepID=U6H4A5_9EIME|nr:hypothetical protein EPH_0057800 [Eimeria praecox]
MLPTGLYGKQQNGEPQNGTIKFSLPYAQNQEDEDLPPISNSYGLQNASPSRSRLKDRPALLLLVGIISVTAFLFMVSICSTLLRRNKVSEAPGRRLSDDGEDENGDALSVIEGCLELESELGVLGARAASHTQTDPASSVEGLVSALHEAAAEHEAMQGLWPSWDGALVSQAVSSGSVQDPSDEQTPGVSSILQLPDNGAGGYAYPSFASHEDGGGSLEALEGFDPEAWLEQIPSIISGQDGGEEAELGRPVTDPPDSVQVSTETLQMLLRPSTEETSTGISTIRSHPFVRLPMVAEGVVIRRFDMTNLRAAYRSKIHPHFFLRKLRKLFLQRVLGQEDVNKLLTSVEGLVGALWQKAQRSRRYTRPAYVTEAYGVYFLSFDAIVCAIQLLGDNMELHLWWTRFVGLFELERSSLMPPANVRSGGYQRRVVGRLLDAIEIYKRGLRPPLTEVIDLKKVLLCSPDSPRLFRDRKWDPWLEFFDCADKRVLSKTAGKSRL